MSAKFYRNTEKRFGNNLEKNLEITVKKIKSISTWGYKTYEKKK